MQALLICNDVFSCTTYSYVALHNIHRAMQINFLKLQNTVGNTGMQLVEALC